MSDPQAIADALERGDINTSQILSTSSIDVTLPAGVSIADLMGDQSALRESLMQEGLATQERLACLEQAHFAFSIFACMSHNSSFDFERKYKDLHDYILKHKDLCGLIRSSTLTAKIRSIARERSAYWGRSAQFCCVNAAT